MTDIRRACLRMITYRSPTLDNKVRIGRNDYTPVQWADQQGGYADCRAALSIAMGVPVDRISPLGYDTRESR